MRREMGHRWEGAKVCPETYNAEGQDNRDTVNKCLQVQCMCVRVFHGIPLEQTPCGLRLEVLSFAGMGWVAIQESGLLH